ncbi:uncharacterized protein LOC127529838 [Erpetoichthys calabaricus]|uniref:uncharacterized protein LOC127529838 n=1 Tax=Erpetoichthys calabaricus TaxID=27687 RepID=UPI00109F666F|nr:uncharacterized protein LOC127529838 [Erpetoichthys calabaricus]
MYTTDNYRTARLKLPVAERHSDLQTAEDEEDDEIPKRTKRRKIANTRFDSDSDGDVCSKPKSHLPPPPKITPPQKFSKSTTKISADLGELGRNAKSMCRMHQPDSVQLHSECRYTECGRCTQEMKSLRNDYKNQSTSTVEEHLTPECVEIANTAFRHWSTSQQNDGPNQDIYGPILRNIQVKQEMMMEQVKVILKTVQDLHEKCCSDSGSDPVLEKDILPLQDLTSMQQLESDLAVGGDLKKKLITLLGIQGGIDVRDTVWRIMRQTFTNSLAKQLNWRGINGKTCFHSLHIKDIVIDAVRRNSVTSRATTQEIEMWIKRRLHLAADRDGGRRARMERQRKNSYQESGEMHVLSSHH